MHKEALFSLRHRQSYLFIALQCSFSFIMNFFNNLQLFRFDYTHTCTHTRACTCFVNWSIESRANLKKRSVLVICPCFCFRFSFVSPDDTCVVKERAASLKCDRTCFHCQKNTHHRQTLGLITELHLS